MGSLMGFHRQLYTIYHYIILPSARALRPTDTPLYIHVHMVFKGLRRVSRVFSGLI